MFIILLDPTEYFTFFISVLSDDHISVAQLSQIYVTRQFQSCTWPVNLTVKKLQHIGSCIWKLHCLNFTRYIHITYYILHIIYYILHTYYSTSYEVNILSESSNKTNRIIKDE